MRKSGIARTSSCFLAGALWLATSVGFQPKPETAVAATSPVDSSSAMALPDYEVPWHEPEPLKAPVQVIDLTVRNVESTAAVSNPIEGLPRPGSGDPAAVGSTVSAASAMAVVLRPLQWSLGEVYVESSEVTESGSVEYTLRASIRGDGARGAAGTEVIAAVRAVSPEVSVLADSLHFVTKPGDELDALSSDSIRIRVKGGLTFEPSMLRWSFNAAEPRSPSGAPAAAAVTSGSEALEIDPLAGPEGQR
jgi:hypothetical protein